MPMTGDLSANKPPRYCQSPDGYAPCWQLPCWPEQKPIKKPTALKRTMGYICIAPILLWALIFAPWR